MIEFEVAFSPGTDLGVQLIESVSLDVDMGQVTEIPPALTYVGKYEVVPKVYTEQTLPTEGKLMGRDVLVRKIPQLEVSNGSGGKTLIIGEE